MRIEALLDTNVIVAAADKDHAHHPHTIGFFDGSRSGRFAVAAHSFAEAFTTLSRRGASAVYRWPPTSVAQALDAARAATVLIGLTPAQTYDAMRSYAVGGGIGARVNDYLIGQAAVMHGVPAIVSLNVGHMRSLFPALDVRTPAEWHAAFSR